MADYMIAFRIPDNIVEQIAISPADGGEHPDELHCTITLFDLPDDVEPYVFETLLMRKLGQYLSDGPVQANLAGLGIFNASESSDNLIPMVALVNMPQSAYVKSMVDLSVDIAIADLTDQPFSVYSDFGYIPHITLQYASQGVKINYPVLEGDFVFDTIFVACPDRVIEYSLQQITEAYEDDDSDSF